jgi:hypothetical protein
MGDLRTGDGVGLSRRNSFFEGDEVALARALAAFEVLGLVEFYRLGKEDGPR